MKRCRTCGKRLRKGEGKYCKTCFEFHLYNYPKDELEQVHAEYERLNK